MGNLGNIQSLNPHGRLGGLTNLQYPFVKKGPTVYNTIYVNTATGNDANTGYNPAAPKATIQNANDSWNSSIKYIKVASGSYPETLILNKAVQFLGSYNSTFTTQNIIYLSTIEISGGQAEDVPAVTMTTGTTLADTIFNGFKISGISSTKRQVCMAIQSPCKVFGNDFYSSSGNSIGILYVVNITGEDAYFYNNSIDVVAMGYTSNPQTFALCCLGGGTNYAKIYNNYVSISSGGNINAAPRCIEVYASSNLDIFNNTLDLRGSTGSDHGSVVAYLYTNEATSNIYFANNILIGNSDSAGYGIQLQFVGSDDGTMIENNSIYNTKSAQAYERGGVEQTFTLTDSELTANNLDASGNLKNKNPYLDVTNPGWLSFMSPLSITEGGADLSAKFTTDKDDVVRTIPWSMGCCLSQQSVIHVDMYVSDTNGDDANDGLSAGSPKKTISSATADAETAFGNNVVTDTIKVAEGTYSEPYIIVSIPTSISGSWDETFTIQDFDIYKTITKYFVLNEYFYNYNFNSNMSGFSIQIGTNTAIYLSNTYDSGLHNVIVEKCEFLITQADGNSPRGLVFGKNNNGVTIRDNKMVTVGLSVGWLTTFMDSDNATTTYAGTKIYNNLIIISTESQYFQCVQTYNYIPDGLKLMNNTFHFYNCHHAMNLLRYNSHKGVIWQNNIVTVSGATGGGDGIEWSSAQGGKAENNNINMSNKYNDGSGWVGTCSPGNISDAVDYNFNTADLLDDTNCTFKVSSPTSITEGGKDLSAEFTTDKDGNTRTVPWSMGCYNKP